MNMRTKKRERLIVLWVIVRDDIVPCIIVTMRNDVMVSPRMVRLVERLRIHVVKNAKASLVC